MENKIKELNINNLTLEEKVGQLLMFAFHGTEFNDQILTQIEKLKVGGVIFFGRNIVTPEQVKRLTSKIQEVAKIPLYIGVDQEGGTVQRIINGVTPFPGAMAISATNESNYEVSKCVGDDLRKMGFNMNFAPVGDVNNNPNNPVINSRSYSDDPKVCAKYVISGAKGFLDSGVIPTCKHFPGHGDTSVDSHVSLPTVNKDIEALENTELLPFKLAIEGGLQGIMASHILYPALDDKFSATLSKAIITDLLKDKMGFKGLIVTDSLTMGAINNNFTHKEIVNLCVNAGVDLMIFCGKADLADQEHIYNSLLEEVKNGNIPMARVDESVSKLLKFKNDYILNNNFSCEYSEEEKIKIGTKLSENSITLVKEKNFFPITDKTLVLFPKIKLFSLVDNADEEYVSLGTVFKRNNMTLDEIIYDSDIINNIDSVESFLDKITSLQKDYEKVILCTYNVTKDDYQTKLWKVLDKDKTMVVSMRSPYDINHLENVNNYICIYEATLLALQSLTKAIIKNDFKGKLPVKID